VDEEIWKDTGIEGYQISSFGNLRSCKRSKDIFIPKKAAIRGTKSQPRAWFHVKMHEKDINISISRLVWTIFMGTIPEELWVDHINRNPLDNRLCNLRLVIPSQNNHNSKIPKKYTNPHRGVYFCNTKKRWRVTLSVNSKRRHLGYFKDKEKAINRYVSESDKLVGEFKGEMQNVSMRKS